MTLDVPQGGGSTGGQLIRSIVILSIVFGPWLIGIAVLWFVVSWIRKKRREAEARRLDSES